MTRGGLRKVVAREGHCVWPCERHAAEHSATSDTEGLSPTTLALLTRMTRMTPAQFHEVPFLAHVPAEYLPSAGVPQRVQALALLKYFESRKGSDVGELCAAIDEAGG